MFFALWPDAAAAAHVHALAREHYQHLKGRVMREDSLHCTLVFIGDVEADRLPDLQAAADKIRLSGFKLAFDEIGCWQRNHIAYLGMRQIPQALQKLQVTLLTHLNEAGFNIEPRTYRPHITLLRKVECMAATQENPATEPVSWAVRDFVLVRSSLNVNGSRYEQIGQWPLL